MTAERCRLVDLNRAYNALRLVKSEEEFDWPRIGCALSDLGIEALADDIRPGMSEHELAAIIERAYLPWGGMTQIHYVGFTAMAEPDCCVPSQLPRKRSVAAGDVVFTEISALFWGYAGQVLRTYTVAARADAALSRSLSCRREDFPRHSSRCSSPARRRAIFSTPLRSSASRASRFATISCTAIGGYLPPVLGTA